MIDRVRLQEKLQESGLSQSELARRVELSQATIAGLFTGRQTGSKHLHRIARALGTTPEYLLKESDNPSFLANVVSDKPRPFRGEPSTNEDDALRALGLVPVKEAGLTLGAGGTYLDEGVVSETVRYFPREWLREFTDAPPQKLVFARVRGDSMKPTLLDGAIVIIDMRRKTINEQDEVWSVAVADIGMVKRIWANPDGSYKIKSDNPNVGPETAHDEEMAVIGRVVASIGKH